MWCHIPLDFQVLVYQAPPQSACFLGTFHNVLTCAYKTGPQWWTSWDDPLWRSSRCSLLISHKNFALEPLKVYIKNGNYCGQYVCLLSQRTSSFPLNYRRLMYWYPIRKLQKSAKVCRTKRFPHFNSQKNGRRTKVWKVRENTVKVSEQPVILGSPWSVKKLFFYANRSTSVRCSPVYTVYIPLFCNGGSWKCPTKSQRKGSQS